MDFTVGIVSRNLASTSRKTIFDATKVIYNTYSCAISGMSKESMKMDGQDSAECQNWEKKGQNGHFWICFKG